MSSPNINNAIIVGCILAYVSAILFSVDGERLTSFVCKVTVRLVLQNNLCFPLKSPMRAGGFNNINHNSDSLVCQWFFSLAMKRK